MIDPIGPLESIQGLSHHIGSVLALRWSSPLLAVLIPSVPPTLCIRVAVTSSCKQNKLLETSSVKPPVEAWLQLFLGITIWVEHIANAALRWWVLMGILLEQLWVDFLPWNGGYHHFLLLGLTWGFLPSHQPLFPSACHNGQDLHTLAQATAKQIAFWDVTKSVQNPTQRDKIHWQMARSGEIRVGKYVFFPLWEVLNWV